MASDTPAQEWSSDRYAENSRFVSDLGQAVLELLNPRPGERILDLGCGDGALTAKIVAAGAEVVGVDASADMVSDASTPTTSAPAATIFAVNAPSPQPRPRMRSPGRGLSSSKPACPRSERNRD